MVWQACYSPLTLLCVFVVGGWGGGRAVWSLFQHYFMNISSLFYHRFIVTSSLCIVILSLFHNYFIAISSLFYRCYIVITLFHRY